MYDFERLLKDNNISETDPDLPQAIRRLIEKFRLTQKKLQTANEEEKENLNDTLDDFDTRIMGKLPEYFELEDEEELERKEAHAKRANAVGLPPSASEEQIIAAEKAKAEKELAEAESKKILMRRAKAVGLQATASLAEIEAAEKAKAEKEASAAEQKKAHAQRAKAAGLDESATTSEIEAAEKAIRDKEKAAADEDAKPATSNAGALEKLYNKGKKTVTLAELKAAGLKMGFFSCPIGPHGCTCGKFKIYRADVTSDTFTLSKLS